MIVFIGRLFQILELLMCIGHQEWVNFTFIVTLGSMHKCM